MCTYRNQAEGWLPRGHVCSAGQRGLGERSTGEINPELGFGRRGHHEDVGFENNYRLTGGCQTRAYGGGPFTQSPAVVTPEVPAVQYQNQEADMGTIHRVYLDFHSLTCTPLCVCMCSSITRVDLCSRHHNQDSKYHQPRGASSYPSVGTRTLLPYPIPMTIRI